MRNNDLSLTVKQHRWIDEFLVDGNATAAAVRAGYSERSARSIAHENMTKPDVQAVLAARQGELAGRLKITRERVIQGLLDAVHLARSQANPAGMVAGLREVAKMLGYYAPEKHRVELVPESAALLAQMEHLPDHELLALIARGAPAQ